MTAPENREPSMPTIEERLAFVEGRQHDHFAAVDDLRSTVRDLRADTNREFSEFRGEVSREFGDFRAEVAREFADVRADMTRQFAEARLDTRELRADMDRRFEKVDVRFLAMNDKIDRHFTWLVGLQMATMVAVLGAFAGAYFQ